MITLFLTFFSGFATDSALPEPAKIWQLAKREGVSIDEFWPTKYVFEIHSFDQKLFRIFKSALNELH